MPRRENPLDPEAGPVQQFACALRTLRAQAGGPTYRAMAARSAYVAATLAQAAAGEKLPSLPVTLAYVAACGGDTQQWEQRWHQAAQAEAAQPPADDEGLDPPYQGLARFEPADQERFFGRDQLITDLHDLVCRERFTAVVGPSGSGKSSLLRAGLIPTLQRQSAPGRRPAALRILTPGPHPLRHAHLLTSKDAAGDTVVVVDQFEETFTLCADPAERAAFCEALVAARHPDSQLRVILAVRADFFGRCAEHRALVEALRRTTVLVGPMSPAELREAIVKPARAAGLIVERELTARIIDETAGEPGALPLVSHVLLETWRRRRGRALTVAAYEAAGGLHGAIAQTAEAAYTRFSPGQADLARRILLRLITPGEGAQDTRRPTRRTELSFGDPAETAHVLEHLARTRLITLDDGVVDLAHEALITAWPRLRSWIEQDREWLRLHRQLTEAARAWEELDRDPGALYRGTRLAAAEEQTAQPGRHDDLTEVEQSFLAASHRAHQAAARRTRRLNTILAGALALALIAAGVAFWQRQTALAQSQAALTAQRQALSRQLAAQSDAFLTSNPDLASLLAIRAYRTSPTTEATASLYTAAALPLQRRLTGPKNIDMVAEMAFSPNGHILAIARDASSVGRMRLWDTSTGRTRPLTGHTGAVLSVAFSPDGRTLAMASSDRTVRLWDTSTGRTRPLTGNTGRVTSVAFSPDGRTLAIPSDDRTVLWDTSTGRTRPLTGNTGRVTSVAFSPDGHTLATVSDDSKVRLWDTSTSRTRTTLTGHINRVNSVAFSPDGRTLATGSSDRTVRLWDTSTGRTRTTLTGHTGAVLSVAFSPDGRTLATASYRKVRLWDTSTDRTLTGDTGAVWSVAFSRDGRTLATHSEDNTVRLWDTSTGRTRTTLTGHKGDVLSVAFSPDGRTLAIAGDDNPDGIIPDTGSETVRLWDTSTGRTRTLTGHTEFPSSMAFSPDGHTLATGSERNNTVRLWDTSTGRTRTLTGHTSGVLSVAFSPDGHTLATGRVGNTVRLWDTSTGRTRTLTGHTSDVLSVAFSPDGRTLATGSGDNTVRLWDTSTGRTRTILTSHKEDVSSVAFSPNGRTLATASDDHTVRLWDTSTDRTRTTLTGHTGAVRSVAFSPDGRTLATGSEDNTVRLWDVELPDQAASIRKICQAVGRNLTAEEWRMYLPGQSPSPVCPS